MELHKIPTEEIRGFDSARRREIVTQIRGQLLQIRMDIFSSKAQHSAKIRGLKKTLARILTIGNQATAKDSSPKKTAQVQVAKKVVKTATKAKTSKK